MKTTKAAHLAYALTQMGAKEVPSNSRKYRTFARVDAQGFYFVGKAGALRSGLCASKSASLERFVPSLLAKYPLPEKQKVSK
jgi:hypothetical protein